MAASTQAKPPSTIVYDNFNSPLRSNNRHAYDFERVIRTQDLLLKVPFLLQSEFIPPTSDMNNNLIIIDGNYRDAFPFFKRSCSYLRMGIVVFELYLIYGLMTKRNTTLSKKCCLVT